MEPPNPCQFSYGDGRAAFWTIRQYYLSLSYLTTHPTPRRIQSISCDYYNNVTQAGASNTDVLWVLSVIHLRLCLRLRLLSSWLRNQELNREPSPWIVVGGSSYAGAFRSIYPKRGSLITMLLSWFDLSHSNGPIYLECRTGCSSS